MKVKSDPPQVLEQPAVHTWATFALFPPAPVPAIAGGVSPLTRRGSETKLEVYKITLIPRNVGGSFLLG